MYTTWRLCVATQTRLTLCRSILQGISAILVGQGIAIHFVTARFSMEAAVSADVTPAFSLWLDLVVERDIASCAEVGIYPVLNSSRMITLFSSQQASHRGPSSYMVSVVVHVFVLSFVLLNLKMTPMIEVRPPARRYTVRIVKLQGTEPQIHWSPGSGAPNPNTQAAMAAEGSGGQPAAPSIPKHFLQQTRAQVTLLQPNVQPDTLLPLETPLPLVVMWVPENHPVPVIVPSPPQKAVAVNARPSLKLPNHELEARDLKLSATAFVSNTLPVTPSTTSPIELHGPAMMPIPQTTSHSSQPPTPTTVVSISDTVMLEGTAALPVANQTAAVSVGESLIGRPQENMAQAGARTQVAKQNGKGPGDKPGAPGTQEGSASSTFGQQAAVLGTDSGSDMGSLSGNQLTVTRITLPKDGSFGVVVVGSSLAEEYPETLATWANRLAYTVYLHVGAAKNWILQYSLLPAVEAAGKTTRPDAPWPYVIERPNLVSDDWNADAILVHGFINAEGHFDQLAIVFPQQFPQTKFVLDALQQWQFRPASQNGQPTAVEVLLIIPEETE